MKGVHGVACLALGLGLGFLTRPSPTASQAEPREELVVAHAEHASSGLPLATSTFAHHDAPALPTSTSAPELERARGIVDDATARGVWTDADREALREQLSTMAGDDQAEIVAQLANAINRGSVKVTPDGNLPL